ncbi:Zinc finger protein [Nesidiocoris tenuis]|uniref:Zinc finger protein n=1 Tax=Nesidiocoris tenuis TaxID=355587 RepID=A0ABN7B1F3_9HEMI|nr:Zinc finger protein [Nesidiocoris tenuis]
MVHHEATGLSPLSMHEWDPLDDRWDVKIKHETDDDGYDNDDDDWTCLDLDLERFGDLKEGSYIVNSDNFLEHVSQQGSSKDNKNQQNKVPVFGHLSCKNFVENATEDISSIRATENQVILAREECQWTFVEENDQFEDEEQPTANPAVALECRWDSCWRLFPTQKELVRHIEGVHVETKRGDDYPCQWLDCPRRSRPFNARYKLLIHMRVHSGEKPNKCPFPGCNKAFSRLENLKIHRRSHTGEKPYACTFSECEKAFSNSSDRAKHQRTHFNQKPYACTVEGCKKRYTDPSSLRKHIKHHSGDSGLPETPKKLMASEPIVSKAELASRGFKPRSLSESLWSPEADESISFFDNEDSLADSISSEVEREFLNFDNSSSSSLVPLKIEDLYECFSSDQNLDQSENECYPDAFECYSSDDIFCS